MPEFQATSLLFKEKWAVSTRPDEMGSKDYKYYSTVILLMEEILHQLIGFVSHYLQSQVVQDFLHQQQYGKQLFLTWTWVLNMDFSQHVW